MHVGIVIPVLNDWVSLSQLIGEVQNLDRAEGVEFSIYVIDDGSSEPAVVQLPPGVRGHIREIEIITLACNLGHQRAIAVGLVAVATRSDLDAVLIMDADGEDRPADIPRLLEAATRHAGHIICAQRQHRPGLVAFHFFYSCYKFLFRLLTGVRIEFGNFCLIPKQAVGALVSNSSVWSNLPGTLVRSRLPIVKLPLDRGVRYAGKSKMGFVPLVMHGLSAIAVYNDIVTVRLMIATVAISAILIVGILWVIFIKTFTTLAIPGWATSAVGILLIILMQALVLFMSSAFTVMSARSMKAVIPKLDAPAYVLSRKKLVSSATSEAAE